MTTIVTSRLSLRPVSIDEVDALHAMWTDADVRRYLWDDVIIPRERAEEVVRSIITSFERDGRGMWCIYEHAGHTPCGFCGFLPRESAEPAELIYGLLPAAWGRGYATESARAVIEYAFGTLNVAHIVAATDVPNGASIRVMERLGMRFVRREAVNGVELVFYGIENSRRLAPVVTESPDTPHR